MMRRLLARLGALFLVVSAVLPIASSPAHAEASIDGAGSTWSQIALDQWRADVARQGLSVNYQGVGSTSGRVFFYQNQIDFAASEIPFTPAYRDATGSVITNEVALARHRPYAYMPDVAGGTSFMYHLEINGQKVTNLRLSPTVIAKIFTGGIKNWNDPSIVKDNTQLHLPSLPIRPVVRSDGSGTTAQFTAFMASQTADIWNAFCARVGVTANPCPSVSLWPDISATSQQFSDGVADYVAAPYNNGAITYVEYGYAKQRGFPVASVLNKAGYFTQPSPVNVAIALKGATLNADLTQNLIGVYTNANPNTYPVSSYSYLIVPTSTAKPFSTAKGTTLSKFIIYMVCPGQQKAAQLGYSPLPENLVQAAFNVVRKIPGHIEPPAIDQCDNPNIKNNITDNVPLPDPGQKEGAQQPDPTPTTVASGSGDVVTGLQPTATTPTTTPRAGKGGNGKGVKNVANGPLKSGGGTDTPVVQAAQFAASTGPVAVPAPRDPLPTLLYVVAALTALLAIFGPPALGMYLKKPTTN